MATHRLSFYGLLVPGTSGECLWQPTSILDVNDLFPDQVLVFADSGTKIGAACHFPIPKNYVGTAKVLLVYKANATTGDVVWDVDYKSIASGESGDPSTFDESVTATDTVPGTARLLDTVTITLTSSNLAVDDEFFVTISRDGVQAADTLAVKAELIDAIMEYSDV